MFSAVKKFIYGNQDDEFSWFLKKSNKSGQFTPDLWQLQMKRNHHVFVYNECMEGHSKHFELIGKAPYLGIAFTLNPRFMMWKKDLGTESYPFVLEGSRSPVVSLLSPTV